MVRTSHDESAFPCPEDEHGLRCWGMSWREYIAVQMHVALLAGRQNLSASPPLSPAEMAHAATIQADALLAELARPVGTAPAPAGADVAVQADRKVATR